MLTTVLVSSCLALPIGRFVNQIEGFLEPSHAIWLPDGNIAVADRLADEVVVVRPNGERIGVVQEVNSPIFIRVDEEGEIHAVSGGLSDLGFIDRPPWMNSENSGMGISDKTDDGWIVPDMYGHAINHYDQEGKLLGKWGVHALIPHEGKGKLHYPNAVDVSPDGSQVIVCEGFEGRIQIFELGDGPPESAPLVSNIAHFGKHIDSYGDLILVAEPELGDLYVLRTGLKVPIVLTRFGGEGDSAHHFDWVHGLWIGDGEIKVVGNGTIKTFIYEHDPKSSFRQIPGLVKFVEMKKSEFHGPIYVSKGGQIGMSPFHEMDNALSADEQSFWTVLPYSEKVIKQNTTGDTQTPLLELTGFVEPCGIEIEKDGNILVSDIGESTIKRFSPAGELLLTFGEKGYEPHQMFKPAGITVLDDGTIVVVDWGNHRAQLYSPDGTWQATFGRGLSWTRENNPPTHTVVSNAGTWKVTFSPTPQEMPLNEIFTLTTTVVGEGELKSLRVDAAMPAHGHGMMTNPVTTQQSNGSFKTTGMLLSMPGDWELYFDIDDGNTIKRAQVSITLEP